MSMMRGALETLREWRAEHATVDVIYHREGKGPSYPIKATQAVTTVTLDNGETISKSKVVDWLIDVSERLSEPVSGDTITFDNERYIVADIGSEHCWRWHDSTHRTRRVHSKIVANS